MATAARFESIPAPRESGIFPKFDPNALDFSDDATLVNGMIANLPRAWRQFQVRYDRLVLRCIGKVTRRFASMVSPDDVREIQATFYVSLLTNDRHKLRSFDAERGNRFSSWIGLLAINCAYDHLRSLRRSPQQDFGAETADLVCEMPDPFDVTAERERAALTAAALEQFSEKDRTFATLYFGEGMDPEQIAEEMSISVKTVYSKKHKIRARLENVLGGAQAA